MQRTASLRSAAADAHRWAATKRGSISHTLIQMKPRSFYSLITALIAIAFTIAACDPTPTSDNTTSSSPTSTDCPPPTPVVIPQSGRKPFLFFVLIEKTPLYETSGGISRTQAILRNALGEVARPGDRVVLAWLSKSDVNAGVNQAIFFDESAETVPTQVPPTSVPTPTHAQEPTAVPTRRTNLGATMVARTQEAIDTAVAATETAVFNIYTCTQSEAVTEYVIVVATLDATQRSKITKFTADIHSAFPTPNPTQADEQISKPVFEGISIAGEFLQKNCTDEYGRCILLLFSDLIDYRRNFDTQNVGVDVKLDGVDVVAVLYDCRYDDGECETRMESWERRFSFYNASSSQFILNPELRNEKGNARISRELVSALLELESKSK